MVTPQPARDQAVISFGQAITSCSVQLVDITGAIVLDQQWSGEQTSALQVDLSHVPAGTYTCIVLTHEATAVPLLVVH